MNLLISVLLGHALGDFYFQTNKMVQNKGKYILLHVILYTLTISFFYYFNTKYLNLNITGLIFLSHYLIDSINIHIKLKFSSLIQEFYLFLLDQTLHIIALLGIIAVFNAEVLTNGSVSNVLLIVTILAYLVMPSSVLIDKVINMISKEDLIGNFTIDEGTLIGILERLLIIVMGLTNAINGIGFLIAAKTMVRYGQFDNGEKEEKNNMNFRSKYLVGTLLSFLLGIILFIIYEKVKN